MRDFTIHEREVTVEEYKALRAQTNWEAVSDSMIDAALKRSLYSVLVLTDGSPVAMGRIVGDGGLYYYLQDIIVHRDFRGQGWARVIIQKLEAYLEEHAGKHAFIGLMAAEGVEGLYEIFGYSRRKQTAPGMFKLWNPDKD